MHEDDGADNANTFLNNGTHLVTHWNPASPNIGTHATNVGAVNASTNSWRGAPTTPAAYCQPGFS